MITKYTNVLKSFIFRIKKGVNVVILDSENRILVMKRCPDARFPGEHWGFPGGKVDKGETLKQAAIREAKEETGLDVEPEDKHFYVYRHLNGELDMYAFFVKSAKGEIVLNEEHTDFYWISTNDWQYLDYTPSCLATLKYILVHL